VVVFHPDEIALSSGPAAGRRRMLDRVALYERPGDQPLAHEYSHALRARQELLRRGSLEGSELDAYELLAAKSGAALTRSRGRAASALSPKLAEAFRSIGDPALALRTELARGGSEDAEVGLRELRDRRRKDSRTPAATWGPHRDDLVLYLDDRPARSVASQGQHRALTLALKAAEAAAVRDATGLEPIQLLDDVSSELDPSRTRALFQFLRACHGQIFLSTTREELLSEHFPEVTERRSFRVFRGVVEVAR
jgi:DNA replication and repair protein RecF